MSVERFIGFGILIMFLCLNPFLGRGQSSGYVAFLEDLFVGDSALVFDGCDFPVGPPNGKGYYVALKFREANEAFGGNLHLGEDWNAVTGGNSDLGDPVYAIANGYVVFAGDAGPGWGNVIRVVHKVPTDSNAVFVESLYAHDQSVLVQKGDWVKRGQQIATIGSCDGLYWAHLHLELRVIVGLPIGGGYSQESEGFTGPSEFIRTHRAPR